MKVKFFTLGCKVNQYETQALMEEFLSVGCRITERAADLYIVNTCTVTSRADRKSKEAVLKAKRENPQAKIAVCGCLAQLNSGLIESLGVDYIVPQSRKASLVDIVSGRDNGHRGIWSLEINSFFNQRAFVKIQDGCDNFCSFCKIPYIRGRSLSRDARGIVEEIERLSSRHKEIVLCGTNLCLYGKDLIPSTTLESLIGNIIKLEFLPRLRLSSLEPYLIDEELLSFLAHKRVCPHLHLSFQSGDDKVLKAMNKKESVSLYEEIVNKARRINPLIAISCDIMVGFPGEDENSFKKTVEFLKRIKPMRMHIFTFSPREKTHLWQVETKNQNVIRQRYHTLTQLAKELSFEYKRKFIGKSLTMIAEEGKGGFICGYTENYIKVLIKEKVPLGEIYPVKIEKVKEDKVFAVIADDHR